MIILTSPPNVFYVKIEYLSLQLYMSLKLDLKLEIVKLRILIPLVLYKNILINIYTILLLNYHDNFKNIY